MTTYPLSEIRFFLESQEEPILSSLLNRSMFRFQETEYFDFEKYLKEIQHLQNQYNQNLPIQIPFFFTPCDRNNRLFQEYRERILPEITKYQTSPHSLFQTLIDKADLFQKDIDILQLLSKRIHAGIYVAQAKYQTQPALYRPLIKNRAAKEILELLTNQELEEKILFRIKEKISRYHTMNPNFPEINAADFFVSLYRDFIIPQTKEVELDYLLNIQ